jgi:hypothetical protein
MRWIREHLLNTTTKHRKCLQSQFKAKAQRRHVQFPHTTCYRKTKWLLNEGLVIVDKIIITPEGKKFSLYHSVLKSINVKYESNNVIVEAEQNFDIIKKTMARFYSLE